MSLPYALLIAGFDYSTIAEDEFHAWYDTEHIPERMAVKGFINAQRWIGVVRSGTSTFAREGPGCTVRTAIQGDRGCA